MGGPRFRFFRPFFDCPGLVRGSYPKTFCKHINLYAIWCSIKRYIKKCVLCYTEAFRTIGMKLDENLQLWGALSQRPRRRSRYDKNFKQKVDGTLLIGIGLVRKAHCDPGTFHCKKLVRTSKNTSELWSFSLKLWLFKVCNKME